MRLKKALLVAGLAAAALTGTLANASQWAPWSGGGNSPWSGGNMPWPICQPFCALPAGRRDTKNLRTYS